MIGTLGAGHLAPPLLELWAEAAQRIPVVAYCRPERGVMLNATYGYAGSERDLRGTEIIPAGFLSPQAARMKLLACLASGLSIDEIALGVSPGRRLTSASRARWLHLDPRLGRKGRPPSA